VVTRFIAGAGGVALRGALALDPEQYDVTILAADGGSLLAQAEAAGLGVVRLRHIVPELDPVADVKALAELVRRLRRGQFDVVHTHSAKAGTLGRLAARRVGVPAIVHTFHGFPFHDFQSRARRTAYIAIERRLGRITDQFLAVGGAVAADAVRLGIASPERIRAIASTVDAGIAPRTPASRAAARRKLGILPGVKVVGTVGRVDFQKAPQDFVRAIAALDRADVIGVWIGGGPLLDQTQRLIDELGLGQRFRMLGERNDVAGLLPALDVFGMSSLYEGLPCALVEAVTCGIPAVATAVNAVPDLIVPGRTGLLVPPRRPEALARAVGHLLDHPDQAASMAAQASERVRTGGAFEPEALGRDLVDTYERALGRGGAVRGRAYDPEPTVLDLRGRRAEDPADRP
jgi:glycosyltransferase involved in cell wall biosynthesis